MTIGCKKNFGVDVLHPDHSINCTAVVVLHLPVLPPFPGHVSLMDAIGTIEWKFCRHIMEIAFGVFMPYRVSFSVQLPQYVWTLYARTSSPFAGNQ